jgi:hypothetical protein
MPNAVFGRHPVSSLARRSPSSALECRRRSTPLSCGGVGGGKKRLSRFARHSCPNHPPPTWHPGGRDRQYYDGAGIRRASLRGRGRGDSLWSDRDQHHPRSSSVAVVQENHTRHPRARRLPFVRIPLVPPRRRLSRCRHRRSLRAAATTLPPSCCAPPPHSFAQLPPPHPCHAAADVALSRYVHRRRRTVALPTPPLIMPLPLRRCQAAANVTLSRCCHRTATVALCAATALFAAATAADAAADAAPPPCCHRRRAAATIAASALPPSRCAHNASDNCGSQVAESANYRGVRWSGKS